MPILPKTINKTPESVASAERFICHPPMQTTRRVLSLSLSPSFLLFPRTHLNVLASHFTSTQRVRGGLKVEMKSEAEGSDNSWWNVWQRETVILQTSVRPCWCAELTTLRGSWQHRVGGEGGGGRSWQPPGSPSPLPSRVRKPPSCNNLF